MVFKTSIVLSRLADTSLNAANSCLFASESLYSSINMPG
nr:MAG TPA: hypothetical protein [Caudoviricetes sp.]